MKKNSIFRWGVAMLLLFTGLSLRAYAEDDGGSPFRKNHDVDLTVKSATLQTFTDAFTKQTGVLFSYESALASMPMGDVSVRESNAPLERILNNVFTKRGFRYKIVDRTVVLTYDRTAEPQRKNSVTGRVCDAAGSPLVGATVLVKDSTRGTTTGADGTYSVEAEPGAVLLFSYIGYTEREEPVGSRSVIDVTMQEDQSVLEEVVVVGYGTQTRKTVTSAISKMDGKTLESMPVNLVGDGMKGRIAGLQVATTDATPGSAPKFLIRGGSSINNSNDPIVLVDGAVREMAGLNPNDIESIEVLKDAASAGIYGSRASNGVILITTKKGAPHKGPQIVFEGQWAYESPATKFDLMNGRDYLLTLRPAIAEGYCGGADPLSILDGAESAGAGNSAASRWTTRYLNPGESLPKGYKWIEDPVNPGKIIVFQDNDQQSQWFDDAFWQNYYIGVNGGGEISTIVRAGFDQAGEETPLLVQNFNKFPWGGDCIGQKAGVTSADKTVANLSLDNETVSVTAGTNASIGGITSTVRNGNPSFYRAIGMEGWTGYLNYMCPGYMQFGAAGDNADGQPGNIISPVLNIPAGYDMLLTFKVGIWAAAPDQGMVGICEKNDGFWISKGTLSKIVASTKSYVSLDIPAYTWVEVSAVIPNPGSLANPSLFISTADSWFSGSTVKAGRWYVDDIKLVY